MKTKKYEKRKKRKENKLGLVKTFLIMSFIVAAL